MGLRDKVALLLTAVVIQATLSICEQSCLNPFDRYARIGAKKVLNNPQLYGQSIQNVGQEITNQNKNNFAEVPFSPAPSQIGFSSFLKQNTDALCPVKSSSDKIISDLKNEARKKRKNEKLKAQLAQIDSVSEHRRVVNDQISPFFPNEMAFPEVEYPVKIEDTWAPKYFNPLPYQVDDPHFQFSNFNIDKSQSKLKDTNIFMKPSNMKKNKGIFAVAKPRNINKNNSTVIKAASSSSSKMENKNKALNDVKVLEPHNKTQRPSSKQKKLRKLLSSQRKPFDNNKSSKISPKQNLLQENTTSILCSEDAKNNSSNTTLSCFTSEINRTKELNVSNKATYQAASATQDIGGCTNACDFEILNRTIANETTNETLKKLNTSHDNEDTDFNVTDTPLDNMSNYVQDDLGLKESLNRDDDFPSKIILSLVNDNTPNVPHEKVDTMSKMSTDENKSDSLVSNKSTKSKLLESSDSDDIFDTDMQNNEMEEMANATIPADISDSTTLTTVTDEIRDTSLYTTLAPDLLYTTAIEEITYTPRFTTIDDNISDIPTYTTMIPEDYTYTPLYTTVDEEELETSDNTKLNDASYTTTSFTFHETTEAPYSTTPKDIIESTISSQHNSITVILNPTNTDPLNNSAEVRDLAENILEKVGPIPDGFEPINSLIPDNTDDVLPLLYPSGLPNEFGIYENVTSESNFDNISTRIKSNYFNTSAEVYDLIDRINDYSRTHTNLSDPLELDNLVEEILNELGPVLDEYLVPDDITALLNIPASSLPTEYFIPEPDIPDFTDIYLKNVISELCPLPTNDQCLVNENLDKVEKKYTLLDILNGTARFDSNHKDASTEDTNSTEKSAVSLDKIQNSTDWINPILDSDHMLDHIDKDEVPVLLDKQSHIDEYRNHDEFEKDNTFSQDYLKDDASPEDLNMGLVSDTDTLSDIIAKAKTTSKSKKQDVSDTSTVITEEEYLPNDYGIEEYSDELRSFDTLSTTAEDEFMPNFPIDAFSNMFL